MQVALICIKSEALRDLPLPPYRSCSAMTARTSSAVAAITSRSALGTSRTPASTLTRGRTITRMQSSTVGRSTTSETRTRTMKMQGTGQTEGARRAAGCPVAGALVLRGAVFVQTEGMGHNQHCHSDNFCWTISCP